MPHSPSRLPARPSLEQLQKQAKELLRAYRAGDQTARQRFAAVREAGSASLADAQFVLAREYGFDTWASLKRHIEALPPARLNRYQELAEDLFRVCQSRDPQAFSRVSELFGLTGTPEQLHTQMMQRLSQMPGRSSDAEPFSLADMQLFVARLYGFESWAAFASSISQPPTRPSKSGHGISTSPPFYKIHWKENALEPRPPVSARDWDEIFEVMRDNGITGLRAAGQMTDAALQRLSQLDLVTNLHLEGCRRVTDAGLAHLSRMPRLDQLNLTGCSITDEGLRVLGQLPELREFYLYHHGSVSDAGLAHLQSCHRLERVDLLGSRAGDGVLHALTGKAKLRHFKSGNEVTDAGLALLAEFPVFRNWQGGAPKYALMEFEAEPNYLLLRGGLTDQGLKSLASLEGLFALNLDDARLSLSAEGLHWLRALPHLAWLGFDATDETMAAIAALPHLRMLMCQDTSAGDAGFKALSASRTLEYIWGRRCHNLKGAGFAAMAQIPSLRGLSVSCKNVDDAALSALPDFPALVGFMPMDVPDDGFRHVGRCEQLEALWCMYCRETGDAATEHIAALRRLKTYYAGQTRITDRSLELLSRMETLEQLTFWSCAAVTNRGVAMLARLPHLRELNLESMAGVSPEALGSFPSTVRVNLS